MPHLSLIYPVINKTIPLFWHLKRSAKKKTLIDFKRALGCALSKHMGLLNKIKAKTNIKGKDSTQKATQKQEEGVGVLEKRIEEVDKELNEINKAIGYFEGQLKASLVLLRDKSKANGNFKLFFVMIETIK